MGDETDLIVADAQGGSDGAFCSLYERVSPALMAWARLRMRGGLSGVADPDDLMQEIWWSALRSFSTFDRKRASFRTWIFGVATNVYRSFLRASGRRANKPQEQRSDTTTFDLEARLTSITAKAHRNECVDRIVATVGTLNQEEQQLFIVMGLQGVGPHDAGAILGITPDAARKRWLRLRERSFQGREWEEVIVAS